MKRRWIVIFVLIALSFCLGYGLGKGIIYLVDNKLPNVIEKGEIYVYPQTGSAEVLAQLDSLVKRPKSLQRCFKAKEVETYIQPGHYVLEPGQTSVYVARMLNNCWQTPVRLTLSGTLRDKGEIARKLGVQMMADSAEFRAAFSDQEFLSQYGFDTVNVFSMLIPDTYEVFWTSSVKEVFDLQKKAYDAFWTNERIQKAKSLSMTPLQVSILASIVSGETNYLPEMPDIACAYLNRLRIGMRLQADPTIAYCFDYKVNRILKKHLEVNSPYNTYKHAGLPPGPIYVPSKAALDAVLNPSNKKYIYFCADPSFNGSHRFASNYSEHLSNARAFQRALTQRAASQK